MTAQWETTRARASSPWSWWTDTASISRASRGIVRTCVVELGIAMADALSKVHEKGVTYGDPKPANAMLTKNGRVKVLAMAAQSTTRRLSLACGSGSLLQGARL